MGEGAATERFQTTSWTRIRSARQDDAAAMEALLRSYWAPVYAYIRRTGRSQPDAADLTQAFFTFVLSNPRLLEQASPARGRFRSYLLKAIHHFLIDDYRREYGRNGSRPRPLSINEHSMQLVEPSHADDPASAFERQWATNVLTQALQRAREQCSEDGMERQWRAFEERVIQPATRSAAATPVAALRCELNVRSEQEVYSMVQTMKRRFHRALLEVVSETVDDPRDAEQELAALKEALTRPL